ncbi:MAG: glutamine-hydrolyzing carbamoyl-phosphate synthase small subunit [Candidatus Latescibacterota bacterium]
MKALIALSDGTVFAGRALGTTGEVLGEMVFNTSMTGYQEILTDPSYAGQIVTMTYPLIGNYGVNPEDEESARPQVRGFVMKECSRIPSSWRAARSLPDYLGEHGVMAVEGIDTRELTRRVRIHGVMDAAMSTLDLDPQNLVAKARAWGGLEGVDLVQEVTCAQPYVLSPESPRFHVVAYDFGIKRNILRKLVEVGCRVTVVPARTTVAETLALQPDGVFLSNGPGDPRPLSYAIEATRQLIGRRPIFGICLGHEILGLACGAQIFHLKFGHRGANQPIKEFGSGRILITSENHGWGIRADSIPDCLEITRLNLNDNCVEGMHHREHPVFSIQCHPEASPGPHDSFHLFSYFAELMERHAA